MEQAQFPIWWWKMYINKKINTSTHFLGGKFLTTENENLLYNSLRLFHGFEGNSQTDVQRYGEKWGGNCCPRSKAKGKSLIIKVFRFQQKTLYWFCCLFSIIIIFFLDATLTGNISVVYGPIPVNFSAHKARLILILMTPKRITKTLPVQSYFCFPNFLTAILCHQRLWASFKKAKNEHRNLKYKHWNCAGSANL